MPQVIWEVTLTNQSRKAIEIGEMGFPMALNNITEVPTRGGPTVETSSLVVQKAIAGAASYLYAHPINGEEPGLLVIPGENTEWEFYNSVPSSLNSSYAWAGIPIVYVCSKATIEREGWPEWANGHSSITMERNESRTIQIAFASVGRRGRSELIETLAMCGAPSIQVFPSAVVPADVGAAVEISGVVPMTFTTLGPAQLESDSDEDGGFCFVRPDEPTPLRLDLTDQSGRSSYVHLKFVQPIETLIKRRAAWIAANQTWPKAIGSWKHSILSENPFWPRDEIESENSFSISGGLADALFLAEKNTLYPVAKEIAVLNRYVEEFLLKNIQNPADMSIGGSLVDERSVAIHYGRPRNYILAMSFYNSLSKARPLCLCKYQSWLHRHARELEFIGWTNRQLPLADGLGRFGLQLGLVAGRCASI